jgi:hypothetical protein
MDEVTVKILHRTGLHDPTAERVSFWANWEPGDQLVQVARFQIGFPACGVVEHLLRIIVHQLDAERPMSEWASEYRRRHRGLLTGDVVIVGEQAFAYERCTWRPITLTADQVWFELGEVVPE